MGLYYTRTGNQRHVKIKNETETIPEPHGDANCARENYGLPTPLQDNPVTRVFLQTWRQTTDHLLYDCEILGKENEKLIAYTSREEDWPVRKT